MVDERLAARAYTRERRRGPAGDPRLDLAGSAEPRIGSSSSTPGSSSLKLRLARRRRRGRRGGRPRRAGRAARREAVAEAGRAGPASTRSVTGSSTAASRFPGAGARSTTPSLAGLRALTDARPAAPAAVARRARRRAGARCRTCPHVACFDTAFHATLPPAASTYAIPAAWRERWALRRYGFHGLSHAYASRRAAELLGRPIEGLRIVTCHLGAGASLAAVTSGRSVDTTMGFTPLEGLVMATRSGSVDPGLVLWLQARGRPLDGRGERRAGARVRARSVSPEPPTCAACWRARPLATRTRRSRSTCTSTASATGIAAMAAAMGGSTRWRSPAGWGSTRAEIRRRAADGLGVPRRRARRRAQRSAAGDTVSGSTGRASRSVVVEAREDVEIARQVRALLGGVG